MQYHSKYTRKQDKKGDTIETIETNGNTNLNLQK